MKNNLTQLSDSTLLSLYYKERDKLYLGELLSRYTLRLLGVCMKYLKNEDDAKDVVQQVYEKALTEIGKYQIDNFGGWLYRIAQNTCISQIRAQKHFVEDTSLNYVASEASQDQSHFWEKDKQHDFLHQALELLKPDQKLCVSLFFLQKKSYQEIASTYNLELKEVKSNIQNGKRNLRILMEQFQKEQYVKK